MAAAALHLALSGKNLEGRVRGESRALFITAYQATLAASRMTAAKVGGLGLPGPDWELGLRSGKPGSPGTGAELARLIAQRQRALWVPARLLCRRFGRGRVWCWQPHGWAAAGSGSIAI